MRIEHLHFLACPKCKGEIKIIEVKEKDNNRVKSGFLECLKCNEKYEISNYIPRFVPKENYASGFGFEWSKHAKTQYDSFSGVNVSESRFFNETGWPRNLQGESILEVGCGSGRFTEQAISTGAMVVSLDYSYSVDANYASNGSKENVLILQGDIYALPIKEKYFDKVFCIGVLQHTPNPRKAFMELPQYIKPKGKLVIDCYKKFNWFKNLLITKYWVRPFTKRLELEVLYRICKGYIEIMWPVARIINKLPKGRKINKQLLIADYRGYFNLSEGLLKEWALLDTFDMLSPAYDYPQTFEEVKEWFHQSGLENIEVSSAYLGILGRGTKK